MNKNDIEKLIDDLVITTTNNSVVTDIKDCHEIRTKYRAIEDKKKEVVNKLFELLNNPIKMSCNN